ncbi:hypothetical protein ACN38_g6803 [Penicillium nordicum]|uniref:Methyltransferase domain-containing protein n=1 Tax=Penicillium nordicum TaxID=229535 RepID=A0A0M8P7I4_9EURO|nr:hypothetical protein ACN38_g6803 [Penicillium nordicum]
MSQAQTAHQDGDERYNELANKVFLILNEGQLHRAPLVEPKVALDLGCGSGIWALEFAKAYPSCQVLGIDINPGSGDHLFKVT